MSITYDYYRIFYYVAKHQSFTKAAKVLMNSQPNITRSMNNLEHALGCRLFLRSPKGVTLTPEGEKLYIHVQAAFEQLLAAEAELTNAKNLQSGHLSIGVSEIALHGLLLPVLRRFKCSYPRVRIQITNYTTPQAVSAVKNGLVDLAVVTTPTGVTKPLCEIPLKPFKDILVAGSAYSALKDKVLKLEDLADYPIICLGKNTKTYEFYDAFFSQHHFILKPDVEVATSDQLLPLVKHDLGISFIPEFFVKDALELQEIIPLQLAEEIPPRNICLIRDINHPLSTASRVLENMIKDEARGLPF